MHAFAIIILVSFFLNAYTLGNGPISAVSVKGILKCGSKAADNVKLRIYRTVTNDPKQILERQTTGPSGSFQMIGNTMSRVGNDTALNNPVLKIYHNCGDDVKTKSKKGFRCFQIIIPKEFTNLGKTAKKVYDIGTLNLQVEYPGEVREKDPKN